MKFDILKKGEKLIVMNEDLRKKNGIIVYFDKKGNFNACPFRLSNMRRHRKRR